MAKQTGNRQTAPVKKSSGMPAVAKGFFEDDYTGFENIVKDKDMLKVPFLRIAQVLTPEAMKTDEKYIKGLEPGMFFNTVSETVFGSTLRAVILGVFRTFVEWKPSRGGFIRSLSPEEWEEEKNNYKFSKDQGGFVSQVTGNIVNDTRNYILLLPDFLEENIAIFPMTGSGLKVSKEWNTKALGVRAGGKEVPLYGSIWELTTGHFKNDQGAWEQIRSIKHAGFSWENNDLGDAVLAGKDFAKSMMKQNIDYSAAGSDDSSDDVPF